MAAQEWGKTLGESGSTELRGVPRIVPGLAAAKGKEGRTANRPGGSNGTNGKSPGWTVAWAEGDK